MYLSFPSLVLVLSVGWGCLLSQCKRDAAVLGKPGNLAVINPYNFSLRHGIIHSKAAFSLEADPPLHPATVGMDCQLDSIERWIFSDGLESIKSTAYSDGIRQSCSLLSVLLSLFDRDLKRRIQERMNG